jgi:hypothetical protein
MYRYLGRNGTITTHSHLEQINPIPMIRLSAAKGKILTDENLKVYSVTVFEDEVNNWTEIEDMGQE